MRTEFPYRAVGNATIAAELSDQADGVKKLFDDIRRHVVAIAARVGWAHDNIRPELFQAWLLSEFGWSRRVADVFFDAAANFDGNADASREAGALDMGAALAAKSIVARELIKARELLNAYRRIVKGDVPAVGCPRSCRPRLSLKPLSRIRSRVYRASLRRSGARPDSGDSIDC